MIQKQHRRRFLEFREFSRYCSNLNVRIRRDELDRYEKDGIFSSLEGVQSKPNEPSTKYYHYFHVHQIHLIQATYPLYAKHYWLLKNVTDNMKDEIDYFIPTKSLFLFPTFDCYDALSYFIELRESDRYEDVLNHIDNPSDAELVFKQYQQNLKKNADLVIQEFAITTERIYQFLLDLLNLHIKYSREEKLKLANLVMLDIRTLVTLIASSHNVTFSDIEERLNQMPESYGVKQKFRYLDRSLEVYDVARNNLALLADSYNNRFVSNTISLSQIDELINFLEREQLFLVPYAIFEIDKIFNSSESFLETSLYLGINSLAIGLESYLRKIANVANKTPKIDTRTLHWLIVGIFNWGKQFQAKNDNYKTIHLTNDLAYLQDVYNDSSLSEELRVFLIAYQSRNLFAHNYVVDENIYQTWYEIIYIALCHTFFYSWVYATDHGWV